MRLLAPRCYYGTISFFCAFFLAISVTAKAQTEKETERTLNNINNMAITAYAAVNAFYNYSANTGDKSLLVDINDAINEVNTKLNVLEGSLADPSFEDDMSQVSQQIQDFKQLIQTNISFIRDYGYPDLRLSDDLSRKNTEITNKLSELSDQILALREHNPVEINEIARTLALTVTKMMTKYSVRSTSSVSQVFQGSETEKALDELALEVDAMLKELSALASDQPAETQELLDSARTKWRFMRKSYVNYNENNVNYVVNLYSKRMVASVQGFLDQVSGN